MTALLYMLRVAVSLVILCRVLAELTHAGLDRDQRRASLRRRWHKRLDEDAAMDTHRRIAEVLWACILFGCVWSLWR